MHCSEWKHRKNKIQHFISWSIWIQVIAIQLLSHAQHFATPWTAAHQCSQFFTIAWSLLRLRSIKLVMPSNTCLPSFLGSGCFPMSHLFISGGQIIGASAIVLPMNIQGWFPRIDWFDLLAVQGTRKSLLQHHSSKTYLLGIVHTSLIISC